MMRAADLFGAEVIDSDGTSIGHVHDLRLLQDGPLIGRFGSALRVHALLVGPTALGVRLGFGRSDVRGPWPMKALFRRIHGSLVVVDWSTIRAIEPRRIHVATAAEGAVGAPRERPFGPRVVDAGLELLDRQIVDPDGRMAGNVDDLELQWAQEVGAPFVSAILAGPGALARRLGGRLGRAIGAAHARLQERDVEGPARIDFGIVNRVESSVLVTVAREELATMRFERWVGETLIDKIPGSGRTP